MCVFRISLENLHAILNHRLVSFFILSKCALVQNLTTNPQDSGPVLKHYYGLMGLSRTPAEREKLFESACVGRTRAAAAKELQKYNFESPGRQLMF
jgi:hypothetical protein